MTFDERMPSWYNMRKQEEAMRQIDENIAAKGVMLQVWQRLGPERCAAYRRQHEKKDG